jgi:Xaa-Pro aminopeptidase
MGCIAGAEHLPPEMIQPLQLCDSSHEFHSWGTNWRRLQKPLIHFVNCTCPEPSFVSWLKLKKMRYQQLSKDLYIHNRANFTKQMKPGGLAVFVSNDIMPTSADGSLPFKQASDIFHLSGVDQEESVLVMFPDSHLAKHREILFLKETNAEIAIWEGAKLDKEQAFEVAGVRTVYWIGQYERIMHALMAEASCVYLNSNEQTRANIDVETREMRFSKSTREKYPHYEYERSAPIMHRIRSVKSSEEIEQMQRACNITKDGLERVLKFVKPGVMEYEIEAEFAHEFLRQGSRGFAYTPIIASGFNACVLHYIENEAECKAGDVILMDVGAEYGNYAADMTRCIPVSGKFTPRQKDVYNSVLSVMKDSSNLLRPGVSLHEYHAQVGELMTEQLLKLKLIDQHDVSKQNPDWPAYKKYFMHGTSHFIGIDVHDVGQWHEPIQEGNVFTVEPGIYIREENLGIRLENDLVVQKEGYRDLMGHIPLEADEIEDLMN